MRISPRHVEIITENEAGKPAFAFSCGFPRCAKLWDSKEKRHGNNGRAGKPQGCWARDERGSAAAEAGGAVAFQNKVAEALGIIASTSAKLNEYAMGRRRQVATV